MTNSYEHSYQHDLDNVIDASDAVLAIGTEKVDTITLKDRSLNNNDATIHGAMRASGYFDGGRIYDGVDDYLDCGNDASLDINIKTISICLAFSSLSNCRIIATPSGYSNDYQLVNFGGKIILTKGSSANNSIGMDNVLVLNKLYHVVAVDDGILANIKIYVNGEEVQSSISGTDWSVEPGNFVIGKRQNDSQYFNGSIFSVGIYNKLSEAEIKSNFNTLARLPLYSHNFERYPNSNTSLTSVFPYTSGIITSGSFNKTDGLKCTSAGQIIFSNSFEFDGSEYITLVINGVEYSGTTTVTQGTITATIAQGSNDITIDMGTGDVLPDIRVQFREEV